MKKHVIIVILSIFAIITIHGQGAIPYSITSIKQYMNDSYTGEARFSYNENGALQLIKYYDPAGSAVNEINFSYSPNGRLAKKTTPCSSCSNGIAYRTYEYSPEGILLKVYKYGTGDILKEYYTLQYENEKVISYRIFNASNTLIKHGERAFTSAGKIHTDKLFDNDGTEILKIETDYAANDSKKSIKVYKNTINTITMIFEYSTTNTPLRMYLDTGNAERIIRAEITIKNEPCSLDVFDSNAPWDMD